MPPLVLAVCPVDKESSKLSTKKPCERVRGSARVGGREHTPRWSDGSRTPGLWVTVQKMTVGWPDGSGHKQRTGGALRADLGVQSLSPAGTALCARAARSRPPGAADSRVRVPGAGVRPRAAHRSVLDVFHETTIDLMEFAINCCIKVPDHLRMGAHGAQGVRSEVRLRDCAAILGAGHMRGAGCGARPERIVGLFRLPCLG